MPSHRPTLQTLLLAGSGRVRKAGHWQRMPQVADHSSAVTRITEACDANHCADLSAPISYMQIELQPGSPPQRPMIHPTRAVRFPGLPISKISH
jgi:hypothetical protein